MTTSIIMLIHTMIWHILIVLIGIYLIVSRRYGRTLKELISPSILFTVVVLIAIVINVVAYKIHFLNVDGIINGDFNLFYISPYYGNPIPILRELKEVVSFPTFVFIYLLAFYIGSIVIWMTTYVIWKLIDIFQNKHKNYYK